MKEQDLKIDEADRKSAEAKAKADKARQDLEGIDGRLKERQDAVDAARKEVLLLEQILTDVQTHIAGFKAAIDRALEHEAKSVEKRLELEAAIRAWTVADMACQGVKDLPAHLIDEKLPELADLVNAHLAEFGSPEFTISFSTRKDNGDETMDILVDNGAEPRLDVTAYSGGQLDRIEFCMRKSMELKAAEMRDTRLGFCMQDEPGTHLDSEKKGALIRMIVERCADGRCPVAVIVSHDPKLMSAIPSRLVVTKEGITRA